MKKITVIAAALCLSVCLCACGGGNALLSAASPETSALILYVCSDGETVRRLTMYDTAAEREILDKLARVSAPPAAWSARDVTVPVYGLEIGRNDAQPGWLEAAWSNGRLILADGSAYKFDFDFAALETGYDWREAEHDLLIGSLPCSRALSLCRGEWISSMLSPARELSPSGGISMTLDGADGGEIAVTFRNDSGGEWSYGTYYHLETLLDGAWYAVPPEMELAFTDIAMILPDGEARQERYSTAPYGTLPNGTYRFVAEGMAVEFDIFS